jgi:hypothetical protein
MILRASQSGNDPLADVSTEMKDQIAGAIRFAVWPPPNVIFGELLKAFYDVGKMFLREQIACVGQKQARRTGRFSLQVCTSRGIVSNGSAPGRASPRSNPKQFNLKLEISNLRLGGVTICWA